MTLPSDKPLKVCNFCGKQVKNLGFHIAGQHPKVMDQLDEMQTAEAPAAPPAIYTQNPRVAVDLSAMIRDKLNTMLDIKIIEMLSKSPNTSIQEISAAINPAPKTTIQDFKEMRDLFKDDAIDKIAEVDTGNQWVNVALQAIPIAKDLLQQRKIQPTEQKKMESENNVRQGDTRRAGTIKPIQFEASGSPGKPGYPGEKPGTPGNPEQQDNRSVNPA